MRVSTALSFRASVVGGRIPSIHSQATAFASNVSRRDGTLRVQVQDDGDAVLGRSPSAKEPMKRPYRI